MTGGTLACATDAIDARWATLEELGPIALFTEQVIRKAFQMAGLQSA